MKTCKGCTKRFVGCHSNCDIYKKYTERVEEINKLKRYDSIVVSNGWGFTLGKKGKIK